MALTVTATATGSGPSDGVSLRIFVLTGAKARASQTGANASQSGAAAHQATMSTAAGSEVLGALLGVSSFTFDSGSTSVDNIADAANGVQYGSFKSTASGSRNVGASAPATAGSMAALEVQASGTIAEDASAPAVATSTTGTSATSASFSPPPGSLIVALVSLLGTAGVATASVSDTAGLTWTEKIAGHATDMGYAGVWIADIPGSTAWTGDVSQTATAAVTTGTSLAGTAAASMPVTAAITADLTGGSGSISYDADVSASLAAAVTAAAKLSAKAAASKTFTASVTADATVRAVGAFLSFDTALCRVLADMTAVRASLGHDSAALVERSLDQIQWTAVRGASAAPVSATAPPVADYEFVPDVVNYYRVTPDSGTYSDSITPGLPGGVPWLRNLRYPFLSMGVTVSDASDITRAANAAAFTVMGRSFQVGVSAVRGARQFTLTVATDADTDTAMLAALLSTGDVVLLQVPAAYPVPLLGGYYSAADTSETRNGVPWALRWTDIPLTEVEAPGDEVTPITSTWETVTGGYETWAGLVSGQAAWADVVALTGAPADVLVS
jgi:hypothetical protein